MPDSSEPIRILVTVNLSAEMLDSFRNVSDRVEIMRYPAQQAKDVPDGIWAKAEVLYTSHVVPEPASAPNLRWIHTHSAGVDHLLDQSVFQAEGAQLTTASGIHATPMAEYVFTMMLAFGHRLLTMLGCKAEANWPMEDKAELFMPLQLRGSTVGIVGYGSVGREIARIASAFGMSTLAVKRDVRHPADPNGYTLPELGDPEGVHFHRLYPPEALVSMARECDFVVVTVPLTDSTRRMIDADVFAAMKPTTVLINVSRGEVVDEAALLAALQSGQIAGAALDVFECEPLPADSPLWKEPNLIISPHIGGMSPDYDEKAAALFIENLTRYIARKDLLNVVDRARGY
jgi:phosphoglycerate dehydrogenase-like enzyme